MESKVEPAVKFGVLGEARAPYRYGHVYTAQTRGGRKRLLIGPSQGHVEILRCLSECLPVPLKLLYVLVVPRSADHEPGRYESPNLTRDQVEAFLSQHKRFFESDGRHHLWVASPDAGTIVYDRHDMLYAYGPIDEYIARLEEHGLRPGVVTVPRPHWHAYHAELDAEETAIVSHWQWLRKPLRESDQE
jgi:hypothetical protein